MERLLTIDDLAARWQRRREAIYWMRDRGDGPPAVRVGKELRWKLSDVEAWEAEQAARDASRRRQPA